MILDAPKETPSRSSPAVQRESRTGPLSAPPTSLPPSRLPRRAPQIRDAPAQPSAVPTAPHTLESVRALISSGRVEEVLLANTEVLFSILNLLTVQTQRQMESDLVETQSITSTLPPYSTPPSPVLAARTLAIGPAPDWSPQLPPTASACGRSTSGGAGPSAPSPSPSYNSDTTLFPSPPTTPTPSASSPATPTPRRPLRPVSTESTFASSQSSPLPLENAPINQSLRNHLASLGVRVLSRVQQQILEALQSPGQERSLIVEGGACEGKTVGMLMGLLSHLRHPSPDPACPQILLLTPAADSAEKLRELLPSHSRAIKALTIHASDPREDARNLTHFKASVVIGTVQRSMELAGGGVKGKGRPGSGLNLSGVRWVGVEEEVWKDGAARESWKKMVECGMGGLRPDVKYVVLMSRKTTPNLNLYINSLLPPSAPAPLNIVGQSDLAFLRSPAVQHFHISTTTPLESLLPIHQAVLLRTPTLIFCSTPTSVRCLSSALATHRAESHTINPDDSPANNHVLFPSSLSSPGQATRNSTVPFLTTPFLGHTADRVSCVVNWDGTLSADDYINRAKKLDAHGSGRRIVVTFTSTPEEESAFLALVEELDLEISISSRFHMMVALELEDPDLASPGLFKRLSSSGPSDSP